MSDDTSWNALHTIVHKTMRKLEKKAIVHAEAFYTSTQTTEVTIRDSTIHTQNKMEDSGVGFRVLLSDNKVGFACTNRLKEAAVWEAAEKAFAIAQVSSELPHFQFPQVTQLPKVKELFDSRLAELDIVEAVNIAQRAINSAEAFDPRVIAKHGKLVIETGWRGISTTIGVDAEEKASKAFMYLGGSGEQNKEVTCTCYDGDYLRAADLDPETLGESVGQKVVAQFNPQPLKSMQGTVIFGPQAVGNQLFSVLVDALKGENVISGRSAWSANLNQSVASEKLTIIDDALLEGGYASRSFDDEGSASQTTVLMQNGVLEGFLHDVTSAHTLSVKPTGNASRYPVGFDFVRVIVGSGYRTKPEIFPSNLVIQPGTKTKDALISEIHKGVLVDTMGGFPQAGSGVISAQLIQAFYIQDGEIKYPIKEGMVSGVAFDWFKQISDVGKDTKQGSNDVMPSLQVEDVKVVAA
jgi:PmbA protein